MAQAELIAVRNAPVQTGPVALKANQTPRRSGTFAGILLGGSLSAVTALGIFGVIDENLEEPTIIAAVLACEYSGDDGGFFEVFINDTKNA